jgi:septal ring factor EnvC (AmiA/AmiB activator)
MRPPKPTPAELQLRRENDGLKTTIICLRREIENKQGAVGRLETLLRERLTRIDQLTAQIDQLRHQNRRLDAENEHLVEIVRLPPLPSF